MPKPASIPKNARSHAAPKKRLSPRGRGSKPAPDNERQLVELFGQNMRLVRRRRELSQEALGDLSDLDRSYISGLETKKRNATLTTVQRIAEALDVDVRLLFTPDLADNPEYGR